jgi:hypothetical protein
MTGLPSLSLTTLTRVVIIFPLATSGCPLTGIGLISQSEGGRLIGDGNSPTQGDENQNYCTHVICSRAVVCSPRQLTPTGLHPSPLGLGHFVSAARITNSDLSMPYARVSTPTPATRPDFPLPAGRGGQVSKYKSTTR